MRLLLLVLLLSLGACGDGDSLVSYRLAVTGRFRDPPWPVYQCTVVVELSRFGAVVLTNSITVGAGVTDTLVLSVPDRGDYSALRQLTWRGRPYTWELVGTWADSQTVYIPGSGRLDCP